MSSNKTQKQTPALQQSCPTCKAVFINDTQYQEHLKLHGDANKPSKKLPVLCKLPLCNTLCADKESYDKHLLTHGDLLPGGFSGDVGGTSSQEDGNVFADGGGDRGGKASSKESEKGVKRKRRIKQESYLSEFTSGVSDVEIRRKKGGIAIGAVIQSRVASRKKQKMDVPSEEKNTPLPDTVHQVICPHCNVQMFAPMALCMAHIKTHSQSKDGASNEHEEGDSTGSVFKNPVVCMYKDNRLSTHCQAKALTFACCDCPKTFTCYKLFVAHAQIHVRRKESSTVKTQIKDAKEAPGQRSNTTTHQEQSAVHQAPVGSDEHQHALRPIQGVSIIDYVQQAVDKAGIIEKALGTTQSTTDKETPLQESEQEVIIKQEIPSPEQALPSPSQPPKRQEPPSTEQTPTKSGAKMFTCHNNACTFKSYSSWEHHVHVSNIHPIPVVANVATHCTSPFILNVPNVAHRTLKQGANRPVYKTPMGVESQNFHSQSDPPPLQSISPGDDQQMSVSLFKCAICCHEYNNYDTFYKSHMQQVEPGLLQKGRSQKSKPNDTSLAYACVHCDRNFHAYYLYMNHMQSHMTKVDKPSSSFQKSPSQIQMSPPPTLSDKMYAPLRCKICHKRCFTKTDYHKHEKMCRDKERRKRSQEIAASNSGSVPMVRCCKPCRAAFERLDLYHAHMTSPKHVQTTAWFYSEKLEELKKNLKENFVPFFTQAEDCIPCKLAFDRIDLYYAHMMSDEHAQKSEAFYSATPTEQWVSNLPNNPQGNQPPKSYKKGRTVREQLDYAREQVTQESELIPPAQTFHKQLDPHPAVVPQVHAGQNEVVEESAKPESGRLELISDGDGVSRWVVVPPTKQNSSRDLTSSEKDVEVLEDIHQVASSVSSTHSPQATGPVAASESTGSVSNMTPSANQSSRLQGSEAGQAKQKKPIKGLIDILDSIGSFRGFTSGSQSQESIPQNALEADYENSSQSFHNAGTTSSNVESSSSADRPVPCDQQPAMSSSSSVPNSTSIIPKEPAKPLQPFSKFYSGVWQKEKTNPNQCIEGVGLIVSRMWESLHPEKKASLQREYERGLVIYNEAMKSYRDYLNRFRPLGMTLPYMQENQSSVSAASVQLNHESGVEAAATCVTSTTTSVNSSAETLQGSSGDTSNPGQNSGQSKPMEAIASDSDSTHAVQKTSSEMIAPGPPDEVIMDLSPTDNSKTNNLDSSTSPVSSKDTSDEPDNATKVTDKTGEPQADAANSKNSTDSVVLSEKSSVDITPINETTVIPSNGATALQSSTGAKEMVAAAETGVRSTIEPVDTVGTERSDPLTVTGETSCSEGVTDTTTTTTPSEASQKTIDQSEASQEPSNQSKASQKPDDQSNVSNTEVAQSNTMVDSTSKFKEGLDTTGGGGGGDDDDDDDDVIPLDEPVSKKPTEVIDLTDDDGLDMETSTDRPTMSGGPANQMGFIMGGLRPPPSPSTPFQKFHRDTYLGVQQDNEELSYPDIKKVIRNMWRFLPREEREAYQNEYELEVQKYNKRINDYCREVNSRRKSAGMREMNRAGIPSTALAVSGASAQFANPRHTSTQSTYSYAQSPAMLDPAISTASTISAIPPNALAAAYDAMPRVPDPPLKPYNRFYQSGILEQVKKEHPEMTGWELNKIVGQIWKDMAPSVKAVYNMEYEAKRKQYEDALHEYTSSPAYQRWLRMQGVERAARAAHTSTSQGSSSYQHQGSSVPQVTADGNSYYTAGPNPSLIPHHLATPYNNLPTSYLQLQQAAKKANQPQPPEPPKKKKPLAAYMRFSKKVYRDVKAQNPDLTFIELGKKIGRMWRELPKEEADAYRQAYLDDKREYDKEKIIKRRPVPLPETVQSITYDNWLQYYSKNKGPIVSKAIPPVHAVPSEVQMDTSLPLISRQSQHKIHEGAPHAPRFQENQNLYQNRNGVQTASSYQPMQTSQKSPSSQNIGYKEPASHGNSSASYVISYGDSTPQDAMKELDRLFAVAKPSTSQDSSGSPDKSFKCKHCGQVIFGHELYLTHCKQHDEEHANTCLECHRHFTDQQALMQHKETHKVSVGQEKSNPDLQKKQFLSLPTNHPLSNIKNMKDAFLCIYCLKAIKITDLERHQEGCGIVVDMTASPDDMENDEPSDEYLQGNTNLSLKAGLKNSSSSLLSRSSHFTEVDNAVEDLGRNSPKGNIGTGGNDDDDDADDEDDEISRWEVAPGTSNTLFPVKYIVKGDDVKDRTAAQECVTPIGVDGDQTSENLQISSGDLQSDDGGGRKKVEEKCQHCNKMIHCDDLLQFTWHISNCLKTRVSCPYCLSSYFYESTFQMKMHLATCRGEKAATISNLLSEEIHRCDHCNLNYDNKAALQIHVDFHTVDELLAPNANRQPKASAVTNEASSEAPAVEGKDFHLKCPHCNVDMFFKEKMGLKMHLATCIDPATRKKMYSASSDKNSTACEYCNKNFDTREDLEKHVAHHPLDGLMKSFKCKDCGQQFRFEKGFISHKRVHEKDKKMHEVGKYEASDKNWFGAGTLQISSVQGGVSIDMDAVHSPIDSPKECETYMLCPHCDKDVGYDTDEELKIHLATCVAMNEEKKKKQDVLLASYHGVCEICDAYFTTKVNLTTHVIGHTMKELLTCKYCISCNQRFRHERDLLMHRSVEHGIEILPDQEEEMQGASTSVVKEMIFMHPQDHSNIEEAELSVTASRKPAHHVSCSHCDMEIYYNTEDELRVHLATCIGKYAEKLQKSAETKEDWKYTCEVCAGRDTISHFGSYRGIMAHVRTHNFTHLLMVKSCNVCDNRFRTKDQLADHTRKWHGHCKKPMQEIMSTISQKSGKQDGVTLENPRIKTTKEATSMKCPHCDLNITYRLVEDLKYHLCVCIKGWHGPEPNTVCQICGTRRNEKLDLWTHAQTHLLNDLMTPRTISWNLHNRHLLVDLVSNLKRPTSHSANQSQSEEVKEEELISPKPKRFKTNDSYKSKQKSGTSESQVDDPSDSESSLENPSKCVACNRALLNMRRNTENPHQCRFCQLVIPSSTELRQHERDHSTVHICVKCSVCYDRFATKDALNAHILKHIRNYSTNFSMNNNELICSICDYRGKRENAETFVCHARSHSLEERYLTSAKASGTLGQSSIVVTKDQEQSDNKNQVITVDLLNKMMPDSDELKIKREKDTGECSDTIIVRCRLPNSEEAENSVDLGKDSNPEVSSKENSSSDDSQTSKMAEDDARDNLTKDCQNDGSEATAMAGGTEQKSGLQCGHLAEDNVSTNRNTSSPTTISNQSIVTPLPENTDSNNANIDDDACNSNAIDIREQVDACIQDNSCDSNDNMNVDTVNVTKTCKEMEGCSNQLDEHNYSKSPKSARMGTEDQSKKSGHQADCQTGTDADKIKDSMPLDEQEKPSGKNVAEDTSPMQPVAKQPQLVTVDSHESLDKDQIKKRETSSKSTTEKVNKNSEDLEDSQSDNGDKPVTGGVSSSSGIAEMRVGLTLEHSYSKAWCINSSCENNAKEGGDRANSIEEKMDCDASDFQEGKKDFDSVVRGKCVEGNSDVVGNNSQTAKQDAPTEVSKDKCDGNKNGNESVPKEKLTYDSESNEKSSLEADHEELRPMLQNSDMPNTENQSGDESLNKCSDTSNDNDIEFHNSSELSHSKEEKPSRSKDGENAPQSVAASSQNKREESSGSKDNKSCHDPTPELTQDKEEKSSGSRSNKDCQNPASNLSKDTKEMSSNSKDDNNSAKNACQDKEEKCSSSKGNADCQNSASELSKHTKEMASNSKDDENSTKNACQDKEEKCSSSKGNTGCHNSASELSEDTEEISSNSKDDKNSPKNASASCEDQEEKCSSSNGNEDCHNSASKLSEDAQEKSSKSKDNINSTMNASTSCQDREAKSSSSNGNEDCHNSASKLSEDAQEKSSKSKDNINSTMNASTSCQDQEAKSSSSKGNDDCHNSASKLSEHTQEKSANSKDDINSPKNASASCQDKEEKSSGSKSNDCHNTASELSKDTQEKSLKCKDFENSPKNATGSSQQKEDDRSSSKDNEICHTSASEVSQDKEKKSSRGKGNEDCHNPVSESTQNTDEKSLNTKGEKNSSESETASALDKEEKPSGNKPAPEFSQDKREQSSSSKGNKDYQKPASESSEDEEENLSRGKDSEKSGNSANESPKEKEEKPSGSKDDENDLKLASRLSQEKKGQSSRSTDSANCSNPAIESSQDKEENPSESKDETDELVESNETSNDYSPNFVVKVEIESEDEDDEDMLLDAIETSNDSQSSADQASNNDAISMTGVINNNREEVMTDEGDSQQISCTLGSQTITVHDPMPKCLFCHFRHDITKECVKEKEHPQCPFCSKNHGIDQRCETMVDYLKQYGSYKTPSSFTVIPTSNPASQDSQVMPQSTPHSTPYIPRIPASVQTVWSHAALSIPPLVSKAPTPVHLQHVQASVSNPPAHAHVEDKGISTSKSAATEATNMESLDGKETNMQETESQDEETMEVESGSETENPVDEVIASTAFYEKGRHHYKTINRQTSKELGGGQPANLEGVMEGSRWNPALVFIDPEPERDLGDIRCPFCYDGHNRPYVCHQTVVYLSTFGKFEPMKMGDGHRAKFMCPVCYEDFPWDYNCRAHTFTKHVKFLKNSDVNISVKTGPVPVKVGEEKFLCPLCQDTFSSHQGCRSHLRACGGNGDAAKNSENSPAPWKSSKPRYRCPFCPEIHTRPYNCRYHVQKQHTRYEKAGDPNEPVKLEHLRFLCPFCSKVFSRETTCKKHIDWNHRNEDILMCGTCHKTYSKYEDHKCLAMPIKTKEGHFKCPYCPSKVFTRCYNCTSHIREKHGASKPEAPVHTQPRYPTTYSAEQIAAISGIHVPLEKEPPPSVEKPQTPNYSKCQTCGLAYKGPNHKCMQSMCPHCGQSFSLGSELMKHILANHKLITVDNSCKDKGPESEEREIEELMAAADYYDEQAERGFLDPDDDDGDASKTSGEGPKTTGEISKTFDDSSSQDSDGLKLPVIESVYSQSEVDSKEGISNQGGSIDDDDYDEQDDMDELESQEDTSVVKVCTTPSQDASKVPSEVLKPSDDSTKSDGGITIQLSEEVALLEKMEAQKSVVTDIQKELEEMAVVLEELSERGDLPSVETTELKKHIASVVSDAMLTASELLAMYKSQRQILCNRNKIAKSSSSEGDVLIEDVHEVGNVDNSESENKIVAEEKSSLIATSKPTEVCEPSQQETTSVPGEEEFTKEVSPVEEIASEVTTPVPDSLQMAVPSCPRPNMDSSSVTFVLGVKSQINLPPTETITKGKRKRSPDSDPVEEVVSANDVGDNLVEVSSVKSSPARLMQKTLQITGGTISVSMSDASQASTSSDTRRIPVPESLSANTEDDEDNHDSSSPKKRKYGKTSSLIDFQGGVMTLAMESEDVRNKVKVDSPEGLLKARVWCPESSEEGTIPNAPKKRKRKQSPEKGTDPATTGRSPHKHYTASPSLPADRIRTPGKDSEQEHNSNAVHEAAVHSSPSKEFAQESNSEASTAAIGSSSTKQLSDDTSNTSISASAKSSSPTVPVAHGPGRRTITKNLAQMVNTLDEQARGEVARTGDKQEQGVSPEEMSGHLQNQARMIQKIVKSVSK